MMDQPTKHSGLGEACPSGPRDFTATFRKAASTGPFARFFRRRGGLDLTRDCSSHRRYAWLYEDMLT